MPGSVAWCPVKGAANRPRRERVVDRNSNFFDLSASAEQTATGRNVSKNSGATSCNSPWHGGTAALRKPAAVYQPDWRACIVRHWMVKENRPALAHVIGAVTMPKSQVLVRSGEVGHQRRVQLPKQGEPRFRPELLPLSAHARLNFFSTSGDGPSKVASGTLPV